MNKSPTLKNFAKELYRIWITERPSQLAASLAYYAMFSFAPVIFITLTLVGFFIDEYPIDNQFSVEIESIMSPEIDEYIRDAILSISETSTGGTIFKTAISSIALLLTASGLFFQLQFALNKIWEVPPPQKGETTAFIRQRLFSMFLVICVGLLCLALATINSLLSFISKFIDFNSPIPFVLLGVVIITFMMVYKVVPDERIAWRDVWLGALVITLLIYLGVKLVNLYMGNGVGNSALEAAGSFVVLLISFYYFSQVFLFGAVFTKAYAHMFGSKRAIMENDSSD